METLMRFLKLRQRNFLGNIPSNLIIKLRVKKQGRLNRIPTINHRQRLSLAPMLPFLLDIGQFVYIASQPPHEILLPSFYFGHL